MSATETAMKETLSSVTDWCGDYLSLGSGTSARLEELVETVKRDLQSGDDESARKGVARLEWIARNLRDKALNAFAWTNVGLSYWEMGQHDAAINAYRLAEELYGETGSIDGSAHCLRCVGSILVAQGELDRGEQ